MPVLLDSLLGPSKLATSTPNRWRTSDLDGVIFGGRESMSGATVTDESALSLSAVFSGVSLLSEIMGGLPFGVYRKQSDGGKVEAVTHPAAHVLGTEPNKWMTAKQARQVLEWNRRLGGNGFAEIQWTGGGNVAAYWPFAYWRVQIKWEPDGRDFYYWVDNKRRVEKADMLHVPLNSWDGITGKSFLDFAVESIGLGLTVQQAAAYFFANGGRPEGLLKHTANLTKDQRDLFRTSWTETHGGGGSGRGKVGVLWGGWEWEDNAFITPEQQQALEARRFTTEEVARWLKIPPHLLADLSRATFSNIESQLISFVVFTMSSMLVDYEQEFDRKILNPPQLYCKHNVNALMRGDSAARANFYKQMHSIGVYTANHILGLEDENPIGPLGDMRFVPANYKTLEQARDGEQPSGAGPGSDQSGFEPDEETPNSKAMQAWTADIFTRMLRKEANAANRAAAQPKKFLAWMDEFYPAHQETIASALSPVLMLETIKNHDLSKAQKAAEDHVKASRVGLMELYDTMPVMAFAPAVAQLMSDWETRRPAEQAAAFCEDVNEGT